MLESVVGCKVLKITRLPIVADTLAYECTVCTHITIVDQSLFERENIPNSCDQLNGGCGRSYRGLFKRNEKESSFSSKHNITVSKNSTRYIFMTNQLENPPVAGDIIDVTLSNIRKKTGTKTTFFAQLESLAIP
jgi:hypothetical protein